MGNLVYRIPKGSELTYSELDGNLTEIDRRTGKGWNDLVQDVRVGTGTNAPSLTQFRDGIWAYEFAAATMNEVWANFHIRHDYDPTGGTVPGMVYPHVHWSAATTATGVVRWGIEYTLARRHESTGVRTFGPTTTLYIEHEVMAGEQYLHHVNEAADGNGIPGTNLEVDALILCRFFRDAAHINDTYPDPVHLLTVDIHYPCDVLATPSRFPPFV